MGLDRNVDDHWCGFIQDGQTRYPPMITFDLLQFTTGKVLKPVMSGQDDPGRPQTGAPSFLTIECDTESINDLTEQKISL